MRKIISLLLILGTLAFASVILNFDEVDIKTVATEIAKLTGKNLVIDPRVRGKITIISNRELTPQEALELFSQALAMQGYALIDEGKTIKILPSTQGVPFTRTKRSRGGELTTMVYKLENVNASQAINTIRPFLSPYGRVAHNQQANAIIIADYADSINKVRQILNLIDSGKSGGTVKVFNLRYVKPSYVARLLQPVSTLSSKKYGEPSVFSAVDEVGSLAVYTHKDLLPLVEDIIRQVDTPESTETERSFYIIPLNFISAEEIYESLSSLFKGIKTRSVRTVRAKTKGGTNVSFQTPTISLKSGMKIGIDKRSNSLILYATKAEYEAVRRFVKKLDVRRKQVLLSAAIVEASAKDILEKGIRWQILGTKGGAAFKGATLTDIFNAFQAGNFVIGAFSQSGTKVNIGGVEFFFP
ncbi:secretin N-terminal domain-containing protein, partial [Aquifex sp.]